MYEKLRLAEPLFEGQIHECQQFRLTINGEEYKGVYKDDEINWYYPQPTIENKEKVEIEIQVFGLIRSHLR